MRLKLTDEEAKQILQQRKEQRLFNEGWNAAIDAVLQLSEGHTFQEVFARAKELQK